MIFFQKKKPNFSATWLVDEPSVAMATRDRSRPRRRWRHDVGTSSFHDLDATLWPGRAVFDWILLANRRTVKAPPPDAAGRRRLRLADSVVVVFLFFFFFFFFFFLRRFFAVWLDVSAVPTSRKHPIAFPWSIKRRRQTTPRYWRTRKRKKELQGHGWPWRALILFFLFLYYWSLNGLVDYFDQVITLPWKWPPTIVQRIPPEINLIKTKWKWHFSSILFVPKSHGIRLNRILPGFSGFYWVLPSPFGNEGIQPSSTTTKNMDWI